MYVGLQIQDGCHVVGQITLKKFKIIFTMLILAYLTIIHQLQLSKLRNDKNRFQTLISLLSDRPTRRNLCTMWGGNECEENHGKITEEKP